MEKYKKELIYSPNFINHGSYPVFVRPYYTNYVYSFLYCYIVITMPLCTLRNNKKHVFIFNNGRYEIYL